MLIYFGSVLILQNSVVNVYEFSNQSHLKVHHIINDNVIYVWELYECGLIK